ncbi:malonate transporter subunit MadM [Gilliamella sp. wkB108]|uniref:malonate transporter subunit MadM n=1 Tax=Gilliamella sp. wkB108 TaxID=3120256 RepID=UPI00080E9257|nr:malonate transporter subunit MadM [Gilliamella apicola]OCG24263.1 malonate transporter subunit MadM [Gilliamella apicola]
MDILKIIQTIFINNGFVMTFLIVGLIMWISSFISKKVTKGRIASSAIAISAGLILAYIGGSITGGQKGISNIPMFSGFAVMGGAMLRDYAIVSTGFGARFEELKKAGLSGAVSMFVGIIGAFVIGAVVAYCFGYRDAREVATIGAGAVTFIVGPVTGTALNVGSDIIALSIAAGIVKSIFVMIATPFIAKIFGVTNPQGAMVYGGLMGTSSGTLAGLAATDPRLVPYGAVVATFYTGFGCLMCPSILYLITNLII